MLRVNSTRTKRHSPPTSIGCDNFSYLDRSSKDKFETTTSFRKRRPSLESTNFLNAFHVVNSRLFSKYTPHRLVDPPYLLSGSLSAKTSNFHVSLARVTCAHSSERIVVCDARQPYNNELYVRRCLSRKRRNRLLSRNVQFIIHHAWIIKQRFTR